MKAENQSANAKRNRYEYSREMKAIERRMNGVPVRRLKNPTAKYGAGRTIRTGKGTVPSKPVLDFFEKHTTRELIDEPAKVNAKKKRAISWKTFINGVEITENDSHYLNTLRRNERANLDRVDKLLIAYHFLPNDWPEFTDQELYP